MKPSLIGFCLVALYLIPAGAQEASSDAEEARQAEARQHFALGEQYRSSRLFEKAVEEYEKVLEIHPENTDAFARLGYVLTETGEYDKAASILRELIERKPEECRAHESLGYVFLKQAYDAQAEGSDPATEKKRLALLEQAIAAYRDGIENCPENIELHNSIARAQRSAGAEEDALESLQRVVELSPQDPRAYETIAELFYQRRSFPEAIEAYETLLGLPDHGKSPEWIRWAESRIAAMYRRTGDYEKAIPHFERVLEGEPQNAFALEGLAVSLEKTGASARAVDAYAGLLAVKPETASVHFRLAQILQDLGQYKESIARIKKGLTHEMDCSAHAHYLLGENYEKLSNYEAAKREFARSRDCNDPVFRDKAIQQMDRQDQLIKIRELEKKKKEYGG